MWNSERRAESGEGGPLYRIIVLTATALGVGAAASFAAILFVECVKWLNHALLVSARTRVQHEDEGLLVPVATVVVPTVGGLLVGVLLRYWSIQRRSLGPPDVIQSVQSRVPLPDTRSGVISTVAAAISMGFGASVGQYGPMVYLGAMLGKAVSGLRLRIRNLPAISIACGVAAAISTAFNAPVAGLVFAHEVVLRHYSTQSFAPTTIAAATGYVVANVVFARPPLFLIQFQGVGHAHEFVLFGLLGVLGGLLAMVFMSSVLASARLANRLGAPPALRPGVAGLVLGITALWLPEILGIGQELLRFTTIDAAFDLIELPVLVIAKLLLTALCIGFGFAGGVFSPALLIGALFGSLFWGTITTATDIATSGAAVYAICGMMAVTSAVIGAPLTTILIVFELTRSYDITIAAMVAIVMSNLVTHRMFGRSLFDIQLAGRGVDLFQGRDRNLLQRVKVRDRLIRAFPKAGPEESVGEVVGRMAGTPWHTAYVVDGEGRYLGNLEPAGMSYAERVGDVMVSPDLRFDETTTVWHAAGQLDDHLGDAIPVVESESGILLGVVTDSIVIQSYRAVVQELRQEENAPL